MIIILFCIYRAVLAQKCECNEIYFQDLCRDAIGCSFNTQSGICEEIACLDRSQEDCTYFAGKIRCYWDLDIGFCQELQDCEELQSNDKIESNVKNCQTLQCRWDYEDKICVSDGMQKICNEYSTAVCTGAIQVVNYITSDCVLNGEAGDSCIALVTCEDITYKPSCDPIICVYEDESCRTKLCSDYSLLDCPSFNPLTQQQCYPSNLGCVEFVCSDFGSKLDCRTHPRCFWGENLNSCHQQTCDMATYATQCLSFNYVVENAECKWHNDKCSSCYGVAVFALIYMIELIIV